MSLSIVIGTYNRLPLLRCCVESIFEQTRTPVRVVVTDAGSSDGTIEYLRGLRDSDPRVTAILMGKKIGQARSLNQVFPIVQSELVGWLSDDNVVVNRGLDVAASILQDQPKIGMVGLKVKDVAGPHKNHHYIGGMSPLGLLNVNQGMLRTQLLRELGGFCEDYPDYGIDPDLTARVLFKGWDIAYTRQIAIHHCRGLAETLAQDEIASRTRCHEWLSIYLARFQRPGDRLPLSLRLKQRFFRWVESWAYKSGYNVQYGSFLGYNWRDWFNVFHGRSISLWDRFLYRKKPFHLVQHGTADPKLPLQRPAAPLQAFPIDKAAA